MLSGYLLSLGQPCFDTMSGTGDATSMKATIHTTEVLITLLNTSLRDRPFTLQKRNINSGNLAGKSHPDREVSKQVLSGSIKSKLFCNKASFRFFYSCIVSVSPSAKPFKDFLFCSKENYFQDPY